MLRWTIVWMLILVVASGSLAQKRIQDSHCTGVLHGVISDQQGKPVQGIGVMAFPLSLTDQLHPDTRLPKVTTNQTGWYGFAQLCPGEYTVVPLDPAWHGYINPWLFEFLSAQQMKKVKLSRKNSSADISLQLAPTPRRIRLYVSDRETVVPVGHFVIEIVVPGQRYGGTVWLEFLTQSTEPEIEIEVPAHKDFVLHIMAGGFREWHQRIAGTREPSVCGTADSLKIELEPLKRPRSR